ncbi:MAG: carboxypeptidase-like regulatory domain-containing protein [Terriglobales bacterium]
MRRLYRIALLLAALTASVFAQAGQNVTGVVLNLTTGTPLAQVSVTLVQLKDNMNVVATTTTDSGGHFRFSENLPGPFMVQVNFQGVPYFSKVTKGQAETNVRVYNASSNPKLLDVDAEIMVLQPDQGQLAVVNEYRVENGLQPMRTLAAKGGLFRFRVPAGAHVDMVRVQAPNELPLASTALPTADHNVYRVAAPLRPGETRIQTAYNVPYAGLKAALTATPVFVPKHFEVYVPQQMQFSGAGFVQVGAQQGYNVYGITGGPIPATVHFRVSGNAPLPAAVAQGGSSSSPAAAASDSAGAPASTTAASSPAAAAAPPAAVAVGAVAAPTFIERNKWTIFMVLVLAAAAGFGILLSRPEREAATAGALPVLPPAAAALPAAPAADELAKLKDDLFLLEVRRHTSDISEADYVQARTALFARMDRLSGR